MTHRCFKLERLYGRHAANNDKLLVLLKYACGYAVAQLVEALRYKPEIRGFDSR
jgi:hypothetical protein